MAPAACAGHNCALTLPACSVFSGQGRSRLSTRRRRQQCCRQRQWWRVMDNLKCGNVCDCVHMKELIVLPAPCTGADGVIRRRRAAPGLKSSAAESVDAAEAGLPARRCRGETAQHRLRCWRRVPAAVLFGCCKDTDSPHMPDQGCAADTMSPQRFQATNVLPARVVSSSPRIPRWCATFGYLGFTSRWLSLGYATEILMCL